MYIKNQSERNRAFNMVKIMFSPTDYTLKDKWLCKTIGENRHLSMFGILDDDQDLLRKRIKHEYAGIFFKDMANTQDVTTVGTVPAAFVNTGTLLPIIKYDNLYTEDCSLEARKLSQQQVLYMATALASSKSCVPQLLGLLSTDLEKESYSSLYNYTFITDVLNKKEGLIPIYAFESNLRSIFDLSGEDTSEENAIVVKKSTMGGSKYIARADTVHADRMYFKQLKYEYYKTLICGFEVLWALNHLKTTFEDSYKDLCALVCKNDPKNSILNLVVANWFTDCIELKPEFQSIIEQDDPKIRFELYKEFVETNNDKIDYLLCKATNWIFDIATEELIEHDMCTESEILLIFTNYCYEYMISQYRINTLKILYSFCCKNHLLSDTDKGKLIEDVIGSPLYAGGGDKSEERSLMDFFKERDNSSDVDPDLEIKKEKKPKPTIEALDLGTASWKDNIYEFNSKDVYDNSVAAQMCYNKIASSVSLLNKDLIKRIRDIKTYNTGGKNSGQRTGKLDKKALYKYKSDPNIFYDNSYKIKESDLAFGVILDQSGSMSGEGINNGRVTMIVLHETLKALNINHCIIGHTTHGGKYTCEVLRYQSFKEDATYKFNKNYALASICAKAGNCDSGALWYMQQAFSRVKNKDKICIVFSDGEPTECTDGDLKAQVERMERSGIHVIGVGVDFPSIAEYYNDCANGRNLKEMLDIVTDILKRYVLEKRD